MTARPTPKDPLYARASEVDELRTEVRGVAQSVSMVTVDIAKTNSSVQSLGMALEAQGRTLMAAIEAHGKQLEAVADRQNAPKNWVAGFVVAACGLAFTAYMAITSLHVAPIEQDVDGLDHRLQAVERSRYTPEDAAEQAAVLHDQIERNRQMLMAHTDRQAQETIETARWHGRIEERIEWMRGTR